MLQRKQILLTSDNIEKASEYSKKNNISQSEFFRMAIDAYNPDEAFNMEESDLLELVSKRLKNAISSTEQAIEKVDDALAVYSANGAIS